MKKDNSDNSDSTIQDKYNTSNITTKTTSINPTISNTNSLTSVLGKSKRSYSTYTRRCYTLNNFAVCSKKFFSSSSSLFSLEINSTPTRSLYTSCFGLRSMVCGSSNKYCYFSSTSGLLTNDEELSDKAKGKRPVEVDLNDGPPSKRSATDGENVTTSTTTSTTSVKSEESKVKSLYQLSDDARQERENYEEEIGYVEDSTTNWEYLSKDQQNRMLKLEFKEKVFLRAIDKANKYQKNYNNVKGVKELGPDSDNLQGYVGVIKSSLNELTKNNNIRPAEKEAVKEIWDGFSKPGASTGVSSLPPVPLFSENKQEESTQGESSIDVKGKGKTTEAESEEPESSKSDNLSSYESNDEYSQEESDLKKAIYKSIASYREEEKARQLGGGSSSASGSGSGTGAGSEAGSSRNTDTSTSDTNKGDNKSCIDYVVDKQASEPLDPMDLED